ncbi:hypothetical protein AgCh_027314 [Apium graveolens]
MLGASLSPDKEPLPDCRTNDSKLLGAKCRILQSLPTRTHVDYRDRAPKAHTRFHLTSPMRTPIDYRRRAKSGDDNNGVNGNLAKCLSDLNNNLESLSRSHEDLNAAFRKFNDQVQAGLARMEQEIKLFKEEFDLLESEIRNKISP